jgi:TolB-like protein
VSSEARIAVLPFEDNSPQKDLGYLANALTEGLIHSLSNVRGLDVRSKGAIRFYYDPKKISLDSLARVLNVDWLVEGSVSRSNNKLRASITLSNANAEVKASTETSQESNDFLELRDTIVADVAVLLRREMGRDVEVRARRAETQNQRAWESYFRAKQLHDDFIAYMLANGVDGAETMLRLADSLAQSATTEDPRWVAPLLLRGRLSMQRVQVLLSRPGTDNSVAIRAALEQGIGLANRAIDLDDDLPDGYELRGVLRYRLRATPGVTRDSALIRKMESSVEDDLEIAVTKDSARAEAWSTLSELYMRQSRLHQAQHTALRAYEADSYYAGALDTLFRLAVSSFEIGDEKAARKWCDEGRRRYPRYHNFVYCSLMLMAWSDTIPANIDSAWRLAKGSNLMPSPASAQSDVMFRLMTASVIARAGKPDSALHVIEAIPQQVRATPALLWIEAAARARFADYAHADSLVRAYVANQGLANSWQLNSRALKPLRRDLKAAAPAERR